jgi:hypothetical protein
MLLRDFTESQTSPLFTINELISQPDWIQNHDVLRQLSTHFKLLAAMLNSAIREHLVHTKSRIEEVGPNAKIHLVVDNLVEEFLTETSTISGRFREMFSTFNLPHVPESVLNGYQLTDESISILVEEGLIDLFQIVDNYSKKSNRPDFRMRISARVNLETKHRVWHGYPSLLNTLNENEDYLYRASVLKKHAASVLFLSADISKDGQRLTQLGNAVAAGVAMIFATLVAFYFQSKFDNFTFPVFAALVVGYMFKDRIKEIVREIFSQRLQIFLHDRRIVIHTQDGVKLGYLKEKVDFIYESQVPRSVLKTRNRDQFSRLDNDGREENIIRHSKEIVLYTGAFNRIFGNMIQITGINDILRYDIRAYLNKMAEPIQERHYIENEELHSVLCHKVYHLNIVSRYRTVHPQKAKIHRCFRLVLDRAGIKRMELIPE